MTCMSVMLQVFMVMLQVFIVFIIHAQLITFCYESDLAPFSLQLEDSY